jgi:hypothetical protein
VAAWLKVRPHETHEADALVWLEAQPAYRQLEAALRKMLMQLWRDAWEAGEEAAGGEVNPQVAADRIARMSSRWLSQVTQTRVQQIAAILAAGGTAAALTAAIAALLGSAPAALMIAITEVTRAMNAAAMEAYRQAGVKRVRWITRSGNPCKICLANEAAGPRYLGEPFPSGSTAPPEHPNCQCALIPAEGDE